MATIVPIAESTKESSFFTQYRSLVKKEFMIQLRYPISFISSFIMIYFIIAIFTMVAKLFINPSATATNNSSAFTNANLATYMFWGLLAYNLLSQILFSLGKSLRSEQETGTLETLFLFPMNQLANLLAKISWGIFINVVVGIFGFFAIELLTGIILIQFPAIIFALFAFICFFLQIDGLAFLLAGLSVQMKESVEPLINFTEFFFMIFCSFFFPFAVLGPLVGFSFFLPMSFSIDLLRSTIFNTRPELASMLIAHGINDNTVLLEWIYALLTAISLPIIGYKYFMHSIYKGRLNGNLSDY